MTFLELALSHVARGLHVVPLKPRDKSPIVSGGCHAAVADESQIRAWWTKTPNANVGIGCGNSNKAVLDIDHGLNSLEDFHTWRMRNGLPETYTVLTGRRPEIGIHMYFDGAMPDVGAWQLDGCSGQVKSLGGLVCAAGCIHPDSGETYQLVCDVPFTPTPELVRQLKSAVKPAVERKPGDRITGDRNNALTSEVGKFRTIHPGVSLDKTLAYFQQWNIEDVADPMSMDEVEECVRKQFRLYPDAEVLPTVVLGGSKQPKPVTDWRERYHTKDEMENAPPISFLIDGFLQCEGITGLAAPVRERKSLIALNVAHALLTGEPLFDHFKVTKRPARVLYLCPEVSLGPFTDRLRKIGLMDYVGETLFCRTLSAQGHVDLDDLNEELPGSVVILDTAIRFIEGKESDSTDIRVFADTNFALLKGGADAVLMLHHSPKESGGDVMTLENALRGSGDMGAFLCCCWGTKLQDPANPYQSPSYLENLKQRDFESQPFEATCSPDCRMHIVGDPTTHAVELQTRRGMRANGDGKDDAAIAFLKAHPELGTREAAKQLKEMGFKRRGKDWVSAKRRELSGTGVRILETP